MRLAQDNILLCVVSRWTTTMSMLFLHKKVYPRNGIIELFSFLSKEKRWKQIKTNKNNKVKKKSN